MHVFMISYLSWHLQERDVTSEALIANLRQQIAALQVDDGDDAEEEEQEGGKEADDDAPDDEQHVTSCLQHLFRI